MYKLQIDKKLYTKLNKNKSIAKYFYDNSIGDCMGLITEYYNSTDNFTKRGWENYYLTDQRKDRLNEIYLELREKLQDVLGVDIVDYIFYRVVCQTYNGFVIELNILKQFQSEFPNINFTQASREKDKKYFTDIEAYVGDVLLFGIQVKPKTYLLMNNPHTKNYHNELKEKYKKTFNTLHYMVYYEDDFNIYEKEKIFNEINITLALKNNQ